MPILGNKNSFSTPQLYNIEYIKSIQEIDALSEAIDIIAECVFLLIMGCMTAQVWIELNEDVIPKPAEQAPTDQKMEFK